jgi:immune inhibitor A
VYGNSYGWRTSYLNLSGFAGTTVNIRFRFDTGDEYNNNYPGWFVDDVSIVASGITPISLTPTQGTVSPNDTSIAEFTGSLPPPGNHDAYMR